MVVFSSTPNIEYNLIQQNLWKEDVCFLSSGHISNTLCWWDTGNHESIEKIKLKNNKFSVGMTIARHVDDFCLLYSYAARSKQNDLREYYTANIFGLIDIGDYFYKAMRDIYSSYSVKYTPPMLSSLISKASGMSIKPYLELVVNNSTIKG